MQNFFFENSLSNCSKNFFMAFDLIFTMDDD